MAWKPDGYTSVAPYLVVDGAQRTIDFLTVVFDAQPLRMHPMGGRLGHAEVRIDDTVLMLADGMDGWPPVASHVHLYVPDVDATWVRALAAGASHLLLDNMDVPTLLEAVMLVAGRVPTEASGGIDLTTIGAKAATGVTYVSVGRLTQSAPAADIGLDFTPL